MNGKDYAVRVMCPHGDGDQWLLLRNREERLQQVLETAWDFECPAHGVQREYPLTATEKPHARYVLAPAAKDLTWQPPRWSKPRAKELRILKQVRVRVMGNDRHGNRFTQTAYSVNLSRGGARLHGIGFVAPGATIELRRFLRKARFRVIWAGQWGTPLANEIGVCCLEPHKNFWGLPDLALRT